MSRRSKTEKEQPTSSKNPEKPIKSEVNQEPDKIEHLIDHVVANSDTIEEKKSTTRTSLVWNHVQFNSKEYKATCNYCTADYSVKAGTSAILRHLIRNHRENIDVTAVIPKRRAPRSKKEDPQPVGMEISEKTKEFVDQVLQYHMDEDDDINERIERRLDNTVPTSDAALGLVEEALRNRDYATDDADIGRILGLFQSNHNYGTPGTSRSSSNQSPANERFNGDRNGVVPSNDLKNYLKLNSRKRRTSGELEFDPPVETASQRVQPLFNGSGPLSLPWQYADETTRKLMQETLLATKKREEEMANYYRLKAKKLARELDEDI